MKDFELYKEIFSKDGLRQIYEERGALSQAMGKDGIGQKKFVQILDEEIDIILKKVENQTYIFTRYKERLIPKGPNRYPRVISIPTIRDRLTLRAVNDIICDVYKESILERPHAHIRKMKQAVKSAAADSKFVQIDVKDFYPNVDHARLMNMLKEKISKKQILCLVEGAISNPTGQSKALVKAIPQGLSISNILSSIYMQDIDIFLSSLAGTRYVDDMLIVAGAAEAKDVFVTVEDRLKKIGLEAHNLDAGKSRIVPIQDGVDYLGYTVSPDSIRVKKQSFGRMFDNLAMVFSKYKHKQDKNKYSRRFMFDLNIKITGCVADCHRYGWMFFFSEVDDISQLSALDQFVKDQFKKHEIKHEASKIKRFVRAYYEIRYEFHDSSYFVNFDKYDKSQKIDFLVLMHPWESESYFKNMSDEALEEIFWRTVKKQTRNLERDVSGAVDDYG